MCWYALNALLIGLMVMMMRSRTGFQGQTSRSYIDEGDGVAEVVFLPHAQEKTRDETAFTVRPDQATFSVRL